MSGFDKKLSSSPFIVCALLLGVLTLSALACNVGATPTEAPVIPTEPPPPAVDEAAPAPPAEAAPESAAEVPGEGMSIVGFWRAKIVSTQVIVFEFQEGGQTVWHYHLFNGDKSEATGTYSLAGNVLTVVIDEPQDLTMQVDGDQLTLTGSDGNALVLHRVANLDDPGPTASTNISQDIVNRWQDSAVQDWIEFKADGAVSITTSSGSVAGNYTINGSSLEMKLANQDKSSTYRVEIDGNVLTLYAQDGSFVDYVK